MVSAVFSYVNAISLASTIHVGVPSPPGGGCFCLRRLAFLKGQQILHEDANDACEFTEANVVAVAAAGLL